MSESELIKQVAQQQLSMAADLKQIGRALEELAAQKKDIEHLQTGHYEHREWLKGHEKRMQSVEKAQEACKINDLSEKVKVLSDDVDGVSQAPGIFAKQFLYSLVLVVISSGATWFVTRVS
ncbi:MAG: hypothetical protein JRG71_13895 [Deltaproteobacteria bacterium]|nr:hypothetical protein [Deltaproteobacteria bacterium]